MFKAFDHPLVVPLAQRDTKAAGPQSNVGERENAIAGRLKAKVVGDALDLEVRLRTVHDAEEVGNLLGTAGLSLVPTELYQSGRGLARCSEGPAYLLLPVSYGSASIAKP
jgi:hypothetical protein